MGNVVWRNREEVFINKEGEVGRIGVEGKRKRIGCGKGEEE